MSATMQCCTEANLSVNVIIMIRIHAYDVVLSNVVMLFLER